MISPSFVGVILAAGGSTRMGRDKALLAWHNTTFLGAAIEMLRPHTEMVIVVAGTNHESLKNEIYSRGAYLIVNEEPERGQFSSLQLGVHEVLNRGRDAAIITPVDRPPVANQTLTSLRSAFGDADFKDPQGHWAVVPEVMDETTGAALHGHPILMGREMIEAILKAPVTATAREVLHAHKDHVLYLPVNDLNVARNVNTPEEYAALAY